MCGSAGIAVDAHGQLDDHVSIVEPDEGDNIVGEFGNEFSF